MIAFRSLLTALVVLPLAVCAAPAAHPASTAALRVLASGADLHEKARACQELGSFGGPEAVPALAALLDQENLADYARSGLEGIKDPAAGKALLAALPKLNGRLLSGVVNSLGVRREVAAVPELKALVFDAKRGVAEESLASLGLIGNGAAAKILRQVIADGPPNLRLPAAHAAFAAATQLAKDGDRATARKLLEEVARALPPGSVPTAAKKLAATL
ncbi:MAG: hypothetical protein NTV51_02015 [Verrucomicrobia bacterium]|nr:hypothetical protein [Verrucomicrobiota bacterium]